MNLYLLIEVFEAAYGKKIYYCQIILAIKWVIFT